MLQRQLARQHGADDALRALGHETRHAGGVSWRAVGEAVDALAKMLEERVFMLELHAPLAALRFYR
jgi:hypothetical protein